MKRLLGWFVDDWVPIKDYDGNWVIDTDFGIIEKECGYQFVYSKFQDRCKLRCWGYKPKSHQMYDHVLWLFDVFIIRFEALKKNQNGN